MNAFDLADPAEEPGFPTTCSTPRSIRNMENLISLIDAEVPANGESPVGSPHAAGAMAPAHAPAQPPSPRQPLGSPRKAKSMTGRDVWHLGKGTGGPRSYGSFNKVTKDKWDSVKPGGETVWDHIIKSEKAKEARTH